MPRKKAPEITPVGVVAKAALVLAAMEYARRRIKPEGLKISTPADVLPLIRHYHRYRKNPPVVQAD